MTGGKMDKLTKVWRTKTGNFIDTEKSANLVLSYGVELEQGYFITKEKLIGALSDSYVSHVLKKNKHDTLRNILKHLGVE